MKHWMEVGAIAVMASGLSVADVLLAQPAVMTPGLPAGWVVQGGAAGQPERAVIGVEHDEVGRNGRPGAAMLVIDRRAAPPGTAPLSVFHTIDATPWRGRMLQLASYLRLNADVETLRRVGEAKLGELRLECDGAQAGATVFPFDRFSVGRWLENNPVFQVAADASRCSVGVTVTPGARIALGRLQLKDGAEIMQRFSSRIPGWEADYQRRYGGAPLWLIDATNSATNSATPLAAPQNLEFAL